MTYYDSTTYERAARATTIPPPSSRTRAPRPGWAASSATSSRWEPGPSHSWIRSASVRWRTRGAAGSPKGWSRGSRATATRWACRPSAGRSCSTRRTRGTRSSTCCASGCCRRPAGARPGHGRRQPGRAARVQHGSRRDRRRVGARLGRLRGRRRRRGQAAQRAGRRPVRGEAPDRGLPRAARRRPRGRDPGPRRRGAVLRDQRDGQPRRSGHGRRRLGRRRCASPVWSRSRS